MCQRNVIAVEKNLEQNGRYGPVERFDDVLFRRVNASDGSGAIVLGEMIGHPAVIIIGREIDGTLVRAKLTLEGDDAFSVARIMRLFNRANDTVRAWRKLPFVGRMMDRIVEVRTEVKMRPIIPLARSHVAQAVAEHVGCAVNEIRFAR